MAAKKSGAKKTNSKRTLISPNKDNRYVRRNAKGQISESDDQGKSLAKDVKQRAKKTVPSGQGDKGDQKRSGKKKK